MSERGSMRETIFQLVRDAGDEGITRNQLAKMVHRAISTVYYHLEKLMKQGRVTFTVQPVTDCGRPPNLWKASCLFQEPEKNEDDQPPDFSLMNLT